MLRLVFIVFLLAPGLVLASGRPSFKPKIEIEHRFLHPTQVNGSGGDFGFQADKISVSNPLANLSYERWLLNWRNVDQLTFGDQVNKPMEQLHTMSLAAKYMQRLDNQTLRLNTLGFSMTYEKQTHDSMSVNAMSMWIKQLQDGWSIVYGGMLSYHPVRSRVLPVAGFSYRMHTPLGWSGTLAYPRSYIAYGFDPKWQFSGGIVYNSALAKLARDSVIEADGYGEISAWQTDMALKYQPANHWSIQASLRHSPLFEFTTYNAAGHRQDSFKMQPTWGAALSAAYQF